MLSRRRRPRCRIDQRALFWWLLVGMSADLVVSALILRALVVDTRTRGAAGVFYGVFVAIGAVVLAVGERVLPRERAKPQEGP